MTAIGYHSCTSMAVKAVVSEVKSRLSKRFTFLEGMPTFFYDFDKGVTPQFLQYYAKVPIEKRTGDWMVLSYSYDEYGKSIVQPRNGFRMPRPVTDTLKRYIDVHYAEVPLLFSVLTNDSKLYNGLANYMQVSFDWSMTCKFPDLLWPTWLPNQMYPLGWYIRPTVPNGRLYMCVKEGLSGDTEPEWSTELDAIESDSLVQWKCIEANTCTVKAANFVVNSMTVKNPIQEDGVMYQQDFGFTLHFADYVDSEDLVGTITNIEAHLLQKYNPEAFDETILIPD